MNCKQVEKLLPLYIGHELDDEAIKFVGLHLNACTRCAELAGNYRETRQLVQLFEPPAFSESVYADIRNRVLNEIERESVHVNPLRSAWELFQRPIWATSFATLMIVAALLLALSFGLFDSGVEQANDRRGILRLGEGQFGVSGRISTRKGSNNQAASLSSSSSNGNSHLGTPRAPRRKLKLDSTNVAAATKTATPKTAATVINNNPIVHDPAPNAPITREETLKIEIQTSDPNIRILWLAKRTR